MSNQGIPLFSLNNPQSSNKLSRITPNSTQNPTHNDPQLFTKRFLGEQTQLTKTTTFI